MILKICYILYNCAVDEYNKHLDNWESNPKASAKALLFSKRLLGICLWFNYTYEVHEQYTRWLNNPNLTKPSLSRTKRNEYDEEDY